MDAMSRFLKRGGRSQDIRFRGATKRRDCSLAAFERHGLHRGKVALRGNRKTRLDYVDPKRLQLPGQSHFFRQVHRTARRLLAIP